MTHLEPGSVPQQAFNEIYRLLIEIRRRRKAKEHARPDLRKG